MPAPFIEATANTVEAAFQVAFPPVDLSKRGRYRYRFTRLGPSLDYSVGFRVARSSGEPVNTDEYGRPDLAASKRPTALVAISLKNERSERVFSHTRRLSEWNWLRNMAEVQGKTSEVPIGGGSVPIDCVGVGPDDGWGTHVKPRWLGTYDLEIQVIEPDQEVVELVAVPVMEAYVAWP